MIHLLSADIPLLGWQSVSSPNLETKASSFTLTCPLVLPARFFPLKKIFFFFLLYLAAPSLSSTLDLELQHANS